MTSMFHLWSQEYPQVHISNSQHNFQLSIITSRLSNEKACHDVRSVIEAHLIADTPSFQRTKMFASYLNKLQTVITAISNFLFLYMY